MGMQNKIEIYDGKGITHANIQYIFEKSGFKGANVQQEVKGHDLKRTNFASPSLHSPGEDEYTCSIVLTPLNVGDQGLALISARAIDTVPAIDAAVLDRFTAIHETAHCFTGRYVADLAMNTLEIDADVYAALRSIQLGVSKKDLENIRDARLASLVNSFSFSHDTGNALTRIVDKYDELKADTDFMSMDAADVFAKSRDFAEKDYKNAEKFNAEIRAVAMKVHSTKQMPIAFSRNEIEKLKNDSPRWKAAFEANDRLNQAAKAEFNMNLAGEGGIAKVPASAIDAWFEENANQINQNYRM